MNTPDAYYFEGKPPYIRKPLPRSSKSHSSSKGRKEKEREGSKPATWPASPSSGAEPYRGKKTTEP